MVRQPVFFFPHGGGPWPFMKPRRSSPKEIEELRTYLEDLPKGLPEPPKAILIVSAHWERPVATLTSNPNPPLLFDYYGFPPETYQLTWPAPGSPELVKRVQECLSAAGIKSATDDKRGYDHGVFVPMKVMYPEATIPCVALSLLSSEDEVEHVELGKALAPLRDEGILLLFSGMSYHNLEVIFAGLSKKASEVFADWVKEVMTGPIENRIPSLIKWKEAPCALECHPTSEHWTPILVAAGAGVEDPATIEFDSTTSGGARVTGVRFG